ncbi:MAG: DNA polymerase, partial [candidate division WOR-3 bacterium]
ISKSLATVRTDLDLGLSIEDMRIGAQDRTTLVRLFRELEFSSLLRELMEEDRPDIRLITEPTRVMRPAETTVGLGLDSQYCYVALSGEEVMRYGWDDPRLREQVLGNRSVLKTGHDLKILFRQLMRQGWDDSLWPSRSQMNALRITPDAETNALRLTPDALRQKVGFGVGREASGVMGFADCKIAAWLVDPNRKRYELADLALQYLQKVASGIDGTRAAVLAFRLWKVLSGELARLELLPLFGSVEMPLVPVLAEMETRGVMLNLDFLASLTQELQAELTGLEERIQIAAGRRFNPRSPAQLSQVLFEHLKLTPRRRTKTGFSTDARVMEELAGQSPLASDILKLRELDKLLSTYLLPLMRLADSGGRIHTTLNQTGTATGRLSASEPNLQNIPIRSELGRRIREGVVAQPGFLLISADYSQIELRVLAEVTGDENLRSAFLQGADIHARTASAVLGCPESAVSAEARRIAKMVNYGIIYGMSDYGLAGRLGIAKDEARTFIERYLTLYPRVAQWCQTIPEETRARGWAQTKFGRIRPLPDLDSKVAAVREAAVRAAINTPIQGTAADIVKQAMIAVTAQLHQALFQGGLVLQVHDELLFEIEQDRVHEAQETIRATMESVWDGEIPMRVEIGVGHTWAAAHDNTHSAAKA